MGGEIAQHSEWNHDKELDWATLQDPRHAGVQRLVADINRVYRDTPALWEVDHEPEGFQWIDANDADHNVISFFRANEARDQYLVCVANLSPVPRYNFRIGLPAKGSYTEALNSDSDSYGGSNVGNLGVVEAEPVPWHGLEHSATIVLPPLAVLWLRV